MQPSKRRAVSRSSLAFDELSKIRLHHDQWYDQDSRSQRVSKILCLVHAGSGMVETIGENLGASSGMDGCASAETVARESDVVGRSRKRMRARENDHPITLRRDFDSTEIGNTCSGEYRF
ncbi:DUF7405 family protein [Halococcus hamelinensis]|uniref:Uncharacterized protein n=1 Tax=Halococcus hamelinensis 100A6 TaxID=1132509 RepID=M0LVU3_9EURY|nr:hypothetical protein [Halococcus hamelinensis]EMA37566.1 hypothetical protein C447_12632 [Halococcus hamelinensis 100A6]